MSRLPSCSQQFQLDWIALSGRILSISGISDSDISVLQEPNLKRSLPQAICINFSTALGAFLASPSSDLSESGAQLRAGNGRNKTLFKSLL